MKTCGMNSGMCDTEGTEGTGTTGRIIAPFIAGHQTLWLGQTFVLGW